MRNPPRKAAIFASFVALGLALAWFGVENHVPLGGDWVPGLMIFAGGFTAFACSLWLIQALFHIRGMANLQAGIGRVAQWHVGALDWEEYRAADAAREASDPQFLVNDLWLRKHTPPEGVDVIVGEKALIVDNSYHVLRMNGLPELRSIGWLDNSRTLGRPPDCLEFLLAYPRGKYGGIQYTAYACRFRRPRSSRAARPTTSSPRRSSAGGRKARSRCATRAARCRSAA